MNDLIKFLHDWQTLAAGLAALMGAGLTVSKISRQTQQSAKQHADLIARKYRVARAAMPQALSDLCEFLKRCAAYVVERRGQLATNKGQNLHTTPKDHHLPELNPSRLQALKECVEFADSKSANAVADMLSHLQILQARLRSFDHKVEEFRPNKGNGLSIWDAEKMVLEVARLYAQVDQFFPYARCEVEIVPEPVSKAAVSNALNSMDINTVFYSEKFKNELKEPQAK